MKTTLHSPAGHLPCEASVSRERAKERDTSSELWTLAVATAVVERLPRLRLTGESSPIRGAPTPPADGTAAGEVAGEADLARARELAGDGAAERSNSSHHAGNGARSGLSAEETTPSNLRVEVSDERIGRLQLHVARTDGGLDIVISVADPRVKALIEAEQGILMKTLKDAGLPVSSVQIGSPSRAGTALAVDRGSAEKVRTKTSFGQPGSRWRTYRSSLEEEDADSEGFDFTA